MKDSIKREQNGACSDYAECENVRTKCKVLILQGSPRANGNTAWMAEEYKKAAEAAGHEVTLVNVAKKKIAGSHPAYVLRECTCQGKKDGLADVVILSRCL